MTEHKTRIIDSASQSTKPPFCARSVILVKIVLAVVVVLGILVAVTWTAMPGRGDVADQPNPPPRGPIPVTRMRADGQAITKFVFPKSARSGNIEVDWFISRFLDILLGQNYKKYRMQVTQKREPIDIGKFEEAYRNVESIVVDSITNIDGSPALLTEALKGCTRPVYLVKARVLLRNGSDREIQLFVFRESGRWVSSH